MVAAEPRKGGDKLYLVEARAVLESDADLSMPDEAAARLKEPTEKLP